MRRAADQEQKLLLADRDEPHVGGRDRGGAARRGMISAISPKMSRSDKVPSERLPRRMSTLPLWMTKNSDAASPCLKMTSPALNSRTGAPAPARMPKSTDVSAMSPPEVAALRLLQ